MTKTIRILWTDDEIGMLKAHILFLEERGYSVETCSGGRETIELVSANSYDMLFLDEHMPGLSGIDTLRAVKEIRPDLPVVMITKSEEEDIMNAAIGSKIADYLIKPVKPGQILLAIKKITERGRLVTETTTTGYREEFSTINSMISSASDSTDWITIYKKLVHWELQLNSSSDPGLAEIFRMQEQEANNAFSRFISRNYLNWFGSAGSAKPLMTPSVLSRSLFPLLEKGEKVFLIVIDNLRYDQWQVIRNEITPLAGSLREDLYYSILPTATQYARNALFAGMMPSEIARRYPQYWVNDDSSEGKNNHEASLLQLHLERSGISCRWGYEKIGSNQSGKKVNDNLSDLLRNDLSVLVYNFIDLISHARTDTDVLRELAADEAAYRSITRSWFIHSPLAELLRKLQGSGVKIVLTTDHGTIRVNNPVKVVGDRQTSPNLRYKLGKNLDYNAREVFAVRDPLQAHLPKTNITSSYIFATGASFLIYPNNYNHFASYYNDTFQHGGISMQEMIIPLVTMELSE
jgi:CheY-like chemotaxis protein